jgi:superfamily I DNA/RNA helicase
MFVDENDKVAIRELYERYTPDWMGVENDKSQLEFILTAVIPAIIAKNKKDVSYKTISFGEQVTLPITMGLKIPQYDLVLVDEAQDLTLAQHALVKRAGKRHILVGDPRQAIYLFAGADFDSWNRIDSVYGAKQMPLSVTYRNSIKVAEYARCIVGDIQTRDDADLGEVLVIDEADSYKKMTADTFVIGRKNSSVVKAFFDEITRRSIAKDNSGAPVQIIGSDIAKQVMTTINEALGEKGKWVDVSLHVNQWAKTKKEQASALRIKSRSAYDERIEEIESIFEVVSTCLANIRAESQKDFESKIEKLFGGYGEDDNRVAKISTSVSFLTAHKAKGLEATNVLIIEPRLFNNQKEEKTPAQNEQETNLAYVAMTRAKLHLYFVGEAIPNTKPVTAVSAVEHAFVSEFIPPYTGFDKSIMGL